MKNNEEEDNFINDACDKLENSDVSIERMRDMCKQEDFQTSWEQSCYHSVSEYSIILENDILSINAVIEDVADSDSSNARAQTAGDNSECEIKPSPTKGLHLEDENEQSTGNKRIRRDSADIEISEIRPSKKTKCADSYITATTTIDSGHALSMTASDSCSRLSSCSESSFKSVKSNVSSFKVKKRRLKSETNLFRDVLQRSKKSISKSLHLHQRSASSEYNFTQFYVGVY
ncbi:hypothetical protein EVAR_88189_1 [Eumeta japonica]|uniref:Uncharacterized protein n=1 Tax=Eumeta variegata TaxID=151549 RepID=A0A4C1WBF6_EUMVA|nr:hypothetical protein EVAR_88189_1 [Eumeta japonica]